MKGISRHTIILGALTIMLSAAATYSNLKDRNELKMQICIRSVIATLIQVQGPPPPGYDMEALKQRVIVPFCEDVVDVNN